jgi:thioredoxin-like negative regulator of GroEL
MSRLTTELNDLALEHLLIEHEGYAAIAFLAFDSIPCDLFRPQLEEAAESLVEWIRFWRVDAVENPSVTDHLNVEAVPTVVLFKDGDEVARWTGPYSAAALEERMRAEIRRTA